MKEDSFPTHSSTRAHDTMISFFVLLSPAMLTKISHRPDFPQWHQPKPHKEWKEFHSLHDKHYVFLDERR